MLLKNFGKKFCLRESNVVMRQYYFYFVVISLFDFLGLFWLISVITILPGQPSMLQGLARPPLPLCRLAAGDSVAVRGDEGRPRARPVNSRHNLPVKDTSNQTRNLN